MDLDNRWRNIALILLVLTLFLPLVYAFTGTGSIYEVNSTAQGASGDTGIGSTYTIRYTTTPYQPGSFPAQNDDLTANIGWFTGAIGNTEPNITRIYITTPSGRNLTTEAITCYVNVSDTQEENLTVYFNWYNNSVQIPSLSGAANARNGILTNISTLQSTLTTTGENWTCEAKASDGRINETDWNNATIVITAITTPGGAAGGAAGGGVIRTEIPQPCIEAWICTEWSNCTNNTKTRNCTDINKCGTEDYKPIEIEQCSIPSAEPKLKTTKPAEEEKPTSIKEIPEPKESITKAIEKSAKAIIYRIQYAIDTIIDLIKTAIEEIAYAIQTIFKTISSAIHGIINTISYIIQTVIKAISTLIHGIIDLVSSIIRTIIDTISSIINTIIKLLATAAKSLLAWMTYDNINFALIILIYILLILTAITAIRYFIRQYKTEHRSRRLLKRIYTLLEISIISLAGHFAIYQQEAWPAYIATIAMVILMVLDWFLKTEPIRTRRKERAIEKVKSYEEYLRETEKISDKVERYLAKAPRKPEEAEALTREDRYRFTRMKNIIKGITEKTRKPIVKAKRPIKDISRIRPIPVEKLLSKTAQFNEQIREYLAKRKEKQLHKKTEKELAKEQRKLEKEFRRKLREATRITRETEQAIKLPAVRIKEALTRKEESRYSKTKQRIQEIIQKTKETTLSELDKQVQRIKEEQEKKRKQREELEQQKRKEQELHKKLEKARRITRETERELYIGKPPVKIKHILAKTDESRYAKTKQLVQQVLRKPKPTTALLELDKEVQRIKEEQEKKQKQREKQEQERRKQQEKLLEEKRREKQRLKEERRIARQIKRERRKREKEKLIAAKRKQAEIRKQEKERKAKEKERIKQQKTREKELHKKLKEAARIAKEAEREIYAPKIKHVLTSEEESKYSKTKQLIKQVLKKAKPTTALPELDKQVQRIKEEQEKKQKQRQKQEQERKKQQEKLLEEKKREKQRLKEEKRKAKLKRTRLAEERKIDRKLKQERRIKEQQRKAEQKRKEKEKILLQKRILREQKRQEREKKRLRREKERIRKETLKQHEKEISKLFKINKKLETYLKEPKKAKKKHKTRFEILSEKVRALEK